MLSVCICIQYSNNSWDQCSAKISAHYVSTPEWVGIRIFLQDTLYGEFQSRKTWSTPVGVQHIPCPQNRSYVHRRTIQRGWTKWSWSWSFEVGGPTKANTRGCRVKTRGRRTPNNVWWSYEPGWIDTTDPKLSDHIVAIRRLWSLISQLRTEIDSVPYMMKGDLFKDGVGERRKLLYGYLREKEPID